MPQLDGIGHGAGVLAPRYTWWAVFWKCQFEAIPYSLLFGGFAAWLLFCRALKPFGCLRVRQ